MHGRAVANAGRYGGLGRACGQRAACGCAAMDRDGGKVHENIHTGPEVITQGVGGGKSGARNGQHRAPSDG